jgi:hypothetical protein
VPNAAASPDEAVLNFKIENSQPIELLDLTQALASLGEQYKRFLQSHPDLPHAPEPKLFVKEIRAGSIEAELVEYAQFVLPYIQTTVTLVNFAKHLQQVFEYFSAKADVVKPKMDRIDYEQIGKIINPVAKDGGAQFFVKATHGGNVVVNIFKDSQAANAIQNRMDRAQKSERLPQHGEHSKVLLYWHKTKNAPRKHTGDWAIIESIWPKPVKTVFQDDNDKAKILGEPLYTKGYVVDVVVETIEGEPSLYRILRIHEAIERSQSATKRRR